MALAVACLPFGPSSSVTSYAAITPPPPYVVLIGDVGSGKSLIVEKLTGSYGLASDGSVSFTKKAVVFKTQSQRMKVYDTPGCNPIDQRFNHNFWTAQAMSHKPVSCLLIVVQARPRISSVIEDINKYADAFAMEEFARIISVCITHMDTVTWDEAEFLTALSSQTEISKIDGRLKAVFSRLDKDGYELEGDILGICEQNPIDITIDSELFLRYFEINKRSSQILRSVRKEVTRFKDIKKQFYAQNPIYCRETDLQDIPSEKIDLLFEFHAWMTNLISVSQKAVSANNNFLFEGVSDEAGHIANLTNQLKSVLLELRMRCLAFSSPHGVYDLRVCPHCGCVWAKVIGCSGGTYCGEMVNSYDTRKITDDDSQKFKGIMATFTFYWDEQNAVLNIEPKGEKVLKSREAAVGPGFFRKAANWLAGKKAVKGEGCGRYINWATMAPWRGTENVHPEELYEPKAACTDDIRILPSDLETKWQELYDEKTESCRVEEEIGLSVQEVAYGMDEFGAELINYDDPAFTDCT